jgi:hypothetical protein
LVLSILSLIFFIVRLLLGAGWMFFNLAADQPHIIVN